MPSANRFHGNVEEFLSSQAHVERPRDYHTFQDYVLEPPSTRPGLPFHDSPKVGNIAQSSDFPIGPSQATGPKGLNTKDRNFFHDNTPAVPSSIPHTSTASHPINNEYDSINPPHPLPSRARNIQHEKATSIQLTRSALDSSSAVPELQATLPLSSQESTPGPAVIFPKPNLSESQTNDNHQSNVCSKLSSTSSH